MKKNLFQTINVKPFDYDLDKTKLKTIVNKINKEMVTNSEIINQANNEDNKQYSRVVKISNIVTIINDYCNVEPEFKDTTNIILYRGDPVLTVNICMQALINRSKVYLISDDYMYGVNKVVVSIINSVLKSFDIDNLIEYDNDYDVSAIKNIENQVDYIRIIGDSNIWQEFVNDTKVHFYPYNNIVLYSSDEKFQNLQAAIYAVAQENRYEIEIMNDEEVDDVIDIINNDSNVDVGIVLSENEQEIKSFRDNVANKLLYINENPFKDVFGKVTDYLKN